MSAPSRDRLGGDDVKREPYDVLLAGIDSVLAEWLVIARAEPWAELPSVRLVDSLPEILSRLIRLARLGASHVDEELEERIAMDHGEPRREDGVPVAGVAEEWNALRHACWHVLMRHAVDVDAARTAMQRLDLLVDDAIGYTLRGYYREELDSLKGRGLDRRDGAADRRSGADDRREGTNLA